MRYGVSGTGNTTTQINSRLSSLFPKHLSVPRLTTCGRIEIPTMKFGVVVFPGSNCDHDAWYAVSQNLGQKAEFIWHDSRSLGNIDAVILPGGFSYGDYLRCGAIAKFSPVMEAVK